MDDWTWPSLALYAKTSQRGSVTSYLQTKAARRKTPKIHFLKNYNTIYLIYLSVHISMHINLYKLCVVSHASPTSNSEGTPLETTDPLLRNRLCSSSPETFHCRSQDPRSGLRASGSVTQSNTMQNSSVCSSAQKR